MYLVVSNLKENVCDLDEGFIDGEDKGDIIPKEDINIGKEIGDNINIIEDNVTGGNGCADNVLNINDTNKIINLNKREQEALFTINKIPLRRLSYNELIGNLAMLKNNLKLTSKIQEKKLKRHTVSKQ